MKSFRVRFYRGNIPLEKWLGLSSCCELGPNIYTKQEEGI
jgi:hypothetical protein